MDPKRAQEILRSLADGRDPATGEQFPPNSPYQQAETVRALFMALDALDNAARRARRQANRPEGAPARPIDPNRPKIGASWSPEEEQQLRDEFATHKPFPDIATAHGRTYQNHLLGGLSDSTREAAHLLLGIADSTDYGNFTGTFLATSDKYWPPVILEDIAADALNNLEHRQRDSLNLADAPDYGIGYESDEDVMFWWGATGYVAPQVIHGTFDFVEKYDLWDNFLWGDIAFLRIFVGSPLLETVANLYQPMAQGVALESVGTYTYRTPYYQLSGAQDYNPGLWTANPALRHQTECWCWPASRASPYPVASSMGCPWACRSWDRPWGRRLYYVPPTPMNRPRSGTRRGPRSEW